MTSREKKRTNAACDFVSSEADWPSDLEEFVPRNKRAFADEALSNNGVVLVPILPLEVWDAVSSYVCTDSPSTFIWSRVCKDFQSCVTRVFGISTPLHIHPDQLLIYAASNNYPSIVDDALTYYVPSYLFDDRLEEAIAQACVNNHLALAAELVRKCKDSSHVLGNLELFDEVCARGNVDVARWIYSFGLVQIHLHSSNAFIRACHNRHMHIAKWLCSMNIGHASTIKEALAAACRNGDVKMIDWLETVGMQRYDAYELFRGLFVACCSSGKVTIAKRINERLRGGAAQTKRYNYTRFELHRALDNAAAKGHDAVCEWLLRKRCSPLHLQSAFVLCCKHGHLSTARIILQRSNEMQLAHNVIKATHAACVNGHLHIVVWLRSQFGDASFSHLHNTITTTRFNQSMFTTAVVAGHLEIAQFLFNIDNHWLNASSFGAVLCRGAKLSSVQWYYNLQTVDFHVDNDIAFQFACIGGQLDVAKWIHGLGGVSDATLNDITYFASACKNGHLDLAQWLLNLGHFDMGALEPSNLQSVIVRGDLGMVRWLHEQGCPAILNYRNGLFELACQNGHCGLARWLHDEVGAYGRDALSLFVRGNCVDGIRWLIHMHSTVATQCDHELFATSCQLGSLKVAKFLYKLGVVNLSKIDAVMASCHRSVVISWLRLIKHTAFVRNAAVEYEDI